MKEFVFCVLVLLMKLPEGRSQDTLFVNDFVGDIICFDFDGSIVGYDPKYEATKNKDVHIIEHYFNVRNESNPYYRYGLELNVDGVILKERFSYVHNTQECFWVNNFIILNFSNDSLKSITTYLYSYEPTVYHLDSDTGGVKSYSIKRLREDENSAVNLFFISDNKRLIYNTEYYLHGGVKRKGFYSWNSETRIWEECFYWLYYSETGELEYSVAYPTTMGIEK